MNLVPGRLELAALRRLWSAPMALAVDAAARPAVDAAAQAVDRVIASGRTVYGVNTGFGLLRGRASTTPASRSCSARSCCPTAWAPGRSSTMPRRPPRHRAEGSVARARTFRHSLERHRSPRRARERRRRAMHPVQGFGGRVGRPRAARASFARSLIGEGDATVEGRVMPAREALRGPACSRSRSTPRRAWRCSTARRCRRRSHWPASSPPSVPSRGRSSPARCRSTLSWAATRRSIRASTRSAANAGQIDRSGDLRALLEGSAIRESHKDCPRVQDPYTLRCQPQVMGACLDQMRHAASTTRHRGQRRLGQSARVRRHRRNSLRRQLPRRAGRVRRGQSRARHCRDRRPVRAAHRAACGREPVRVCRRSWSRTAGSTPAS